jgi:hypothetical protein
MQASEVMRVMQTRSDSGSVEDTTYLALDLCRATGNEADVE